MGIDRRLKDVFADAVDGFADVRHVQQLVTLGVDRPALVVGHIIIFQQLLTDIEVTAFHFTLGVGDRLGDPRVLNRLTRFIPSLRIMPDTRSEAKIRIRASSIDR